jgi:hypothetical protein
MPTRSFISCKWLMELNKISYKVIIVKGWLRHKLFYRICKKIE